MSLANKLNSSLTILIMSPTPHLSLAETPEASTFSTENVIPEITTAIQELAQKQEKTNQEQALLIKLSEIASLRKDDTTIALNALLGQIGERQNSLKTLAMNSTNVNLKKLGEQIPLPPVLTGFSETSKEATSS